MILQFFFFQAEDGIRDWSVTGVQTCALPICDERAAQVRVDHGVPAFVGELDDQRLVEAARRPGVVDERSEERRVGKECRSRWWVDHEKKREGRSDVQRRRTSRLYVVRTWCVC